MTYPNGHHPNSLANLKPCKPGERRNPSGKPKLSYSPLQCLKRTEELTEAKLEKLAGDADAVPMMRTAAKFRLMMLTDPVKFVLDKDRVAHAAGIDRAWVAAWGDMADRIDGKPIQHVITETSVIPAPAVLQRQLAETVAKMTPQQRAELAERIANPERFLTDVIGDDARALPNE